MRKQISKFILTSLIISEQMLTSCTSNPETIIETVVVTENITITTTIPTTTPTSKTVGSVGITYIDDAQAWTNDRIWIMNGKVVVRSGGSLTIEAGTIVKAQNGQGIEASALAIAAGASINAIGTDGSSIIFTDIEDSIDYGDGIISPNRKPTDTDKWGGYHHLRKRYC